MRLRQVSQVSWRGATKRISSMMWVRSNLRQVLASLGTFGAPRDAKKSFPKSPSTAVYIKLLSFHLARESNLVLFRAANPFLRV